jgi:MFS family permease
MDSSRKKHSGLYDKITIDFCGLQESIHPQLGNVRIFEKKGEWNLKKPFYGWIIAAVAFLIGMTESSAFQPILSIFMKPMINEFGWSRAAISGSIAVGSLCAAIISPFVGPVLDRQGPKMVAFWGILVLSLGLIGMTFVNRIWQLYLFFGIGRMIAVGVLMLVVSVSISNWFVRKRGRAMGFVWLGSRFGSAVLPLLIQYFILALGWRLAWSTMGVTVFILSGIPALVFLRRRPEDMGLLPDGEEACPNEAEPVDGSCKNGQAVPGHGSEKALTRSQAIRTSAFWLLVSVHSLILFVQSGINFHLYPFLTDQGIRPMTAVMVITVINVSGAFGSVGWGLFSEKIRVQILLGSNLFISSLVFLVSYRFILTGAGSSWEIGILFLLMVVHGATFGGRMPLLNVTWGDFFGRLSVGSIMSFSTPFGLTANAIGPIFAASFFDIYGSYTFPFYFFVFGFALAGILCLLMKPPIQGRKT